MYGDPAAMRKRAAQLQEQATDIRAMADRLVAQIESINWEGRAAADMRSRIHDRAAHLRDCAAQHETAAESLTKHVVEVERLKDAIDGIERKSSSLVADARTRIAQQRAQSESSGVTIDPDDTDRTLDQFVAPTSGHKDWLTVELPGL
ncbi:hypothetical protein ncot_18130 [Nocardioides sp. JQ2195]|uniref:hypothetical protein n=1 Tax=Nocardioides sp. JQ2195 TaxID=2592334 RepID=UPI00143E8B1C|nr:hypothetical protein [Nocardioides sp. JQ2195]QIX28294.1 hypothetical protein ncot_18130 [Nocardioides sp. JQ2195]